VTHIEHAIDNIRAGLRLVLSGLAHCLHGLVRCRATARIVEWAQRK
jgi:hypothetical protein